MKPAKENTMETATKPLTEGMHGAVDRAATAAGNAAMGVMPAIDNVAQRAHAAVDKVGGVISTPDEWVTRHPLQSLGIAFVLGLVVGKLWR
jgi:ElaB/YqjD/DUF883 family membrane-anchored ribosome-binding protein